MPAIPTPHIVPQPGGGPQPVPHFEPPPPNPQPLPPQPASACPPDVPQAACDLVLSIAPQALVADVIGTFKQWWAITQGTSPPSDPGAYAPSGAATASLVSATKFWTVTGAQADAVRAIDPGAWNFPWQLLPPATPASAQAFGSAIVAQQTNRGPLPPQVAAMLPHMPAFDPGATAWDPLTWMDVVSASAAGAQAAALLPSFFAKMNACPPGTPKTDAAVQRAWAAYAQDPTIDVCRALAQIPVDVHPGPHPPPQPPTPAPAKNWMPWILAGGVAVVGGGLLAVHYLTKKKAPEHARLENPIAKHRAKSAKKKRTHRLGHTKKRKRNPEPVSPLIAHHGASFVQEHPWMSFFLGLAALYTVMRVGQALLAPKVQVQQLPSPAPQPTPQPLPAPAPAPAPNPAPAPVPPQPPQPQPPTPVTGA